MSESIKRARKGAQSHAMRGMTRDKVKAAQMRRAMAGKHGLCGLAKTWNKTHSGSSGVRTPCLVRMPVTEMRNRTEHEWTGEGVERERVEVEVAYKKTVGYRFSLKLDSKNVSLGSCKAGSDKSFIRGQLEKIRKEVSK